jgi:PAS domain S-box-containing protein
VKKVLSGAEGVIEHADSWDGQPRVSAYTPVSGTGWGVVVSRPLSDAYGPFWRELMLIAGALSFVVIGFTAFGFYASGRLSEPIIELSKKAKRAYSGDYAVSIDTSRGDELGDLARTFNDIKADLEVKDNDLRDVEERFWMLVGDLPIGMMLIGPRGEYVDSNAAMLRMFGITEDSLAGKTIYDADWALWGEAFAGHKEAHPIVMAFATHKPVKNMPIEIVRPSSGDRAWLMVNAEPQIAPDGSLKQLICTFMDVTDRRLLEESLKLARFSLDGAPEGIFWAAPDGGFYYANDAACNSLGYTRDELLSLRLWDVDPAFTKENWPARWDEIKDKGHVRLESAHVTKDKTALPTEVHYAYLESRGKEYICAFTRNVADLKEAERRLRAVEADFARAQRMASIGNWVWDLQNNECKCSGEAYNILGIPAGQKPISHKGFLNLVHPEDRGSVERSMNEALAGKKQFDVDFRLIDAGGNLKFIHCEGEVAFDTRGKAARVLGMFQDVTERRLVEAERDELNNRLGFERARLEAILRNMPAGIVIAEAPSGRIAMVNQHMEEIFRHKFPASQSIGEYGEWGVFQSEGRIYDPEDIPVARSIRTGEVVTGEEINFLRGDGTWGLISMNSAPIYDNDGRVIDAIATFFDITESKKAENALRESKASLVKAQLIAHLGNWVWSIENNEMRYSDEMCKIYGIVPQDYRATFEEFMKMVHPDDREPVRRSINAALNKKESHCIDFRIIRPDGKERIVHSEGEVVCDSLGKPVRMFGTVQDTTERKQVEGALRDAKMQAELYLDLISHDINNMNQVGLGFLELALEKLDDDGKALLSKPLEVLKNSSMLIDNVRKTRKALTGELKLHTTDLGKMLYETIEEYSSREEVAIHYTPIGENYVMANDLLKDVFSNLVDNAIKHSRKPVVIGIGMERITGDRSDFYKVFIEDDGPGIPDDIKDKIFERMTRGDTKAKGSGLGLYLVKTLVRSFNGNVWVENRVPGDYTRGSRFVVKLPALKH